MRYLPLFYFALLGTVLSGEQQGKPTYPLWDGEESVADYASRANLKPTKTFDIGGGAKFELVLIPAAKFIMGTRGPEPVDEARFNKRIIAGQALLALASGVILVLFGAVIVRAIRKRQRPKYSLGRLLAIILIAGLAVLGGVQWWQSVEDLKKAWLEYPIAKAHYRSANTEEKPAHIVTLTTPFYMGKFVVTQRQYQQVMDANPSNFKFNDNPVECVSWKDAQACCRRLSEQLKETVRLPTEAEWEFACRAGTTSPFYLGVTDADLARGAWFDANSKDTAHPVGQKEPTAFGLYDMHGNVWQWCSDWFEERYYEKSEGVNPQGPKFGESRVLRGGSWGSNSKFCRAVHRGRGNPDARGSIFGFRVVVQPVFKTP